MDIDFLRRIPLFMEFTDEETLTILRLCKQKALRPKEKLFEKGEPSTELYIIERGDLIAYEPFTDGSRFIYGRFGAEDVIGEMSFIDPNPRSATVEAVQMSVLHSVSVASFLRLKNELNPAAFKLLRSLTMNLCERLRNIDEKIADLVANPRHLFISDDYKDPETLKREAEKFRQRLTKFD